MQKKQNYRWIKTSGGLVKKGTMETLASQTKIGVLVQAPVTLLRSSGVLPPETF